LISNRAQVEISKHVQEILRTLFIGAWQSEPVKQHQNFAERWYQDMCNTVLDRTSGPDYCWLLCLTYVCFILKSCYSLNVDGTPLRAATGTTNDISPLLWFDFYEPVYYHIDNASLPFDSKELCSHWVGISENVGNFMTFKILTDDTKRVIYRLNIRSAADPDTKNKAS